MIKEGYLPRCLGIHSSADPFHLVFVDLLDVSNTLEHVGDIVDTSLLDPQLSCCLVYVQHEILLTLYQTHESLRQDRQSVLALLLLLPLLGFRLTAGRLH